MPEGAGSNDNGPPETPSGAHAADSKPIVIVQVGALPDTPPTGAAAPNIQTSSE